MNRLFLGASPLLAGMLLAGTSADAASITVGTFNAEKSCVVYEQEWGREFAAAAGATASGAVVASDGHTEAAGYNSVSRYAGIYAKEWGTELRRECVENFPQVRSTLASALASTGPVILDGQPLTLTGRLTDVGYDVRFVETQNSTIVDQFMVVSIEFQLRNRAGRIAYGGAITKRFNIASSAETEDVSYDRVQSGRTTFSQVQQQVGFAVARAVIFHFKPLRVTDNDGKSLALNYGTPLVPIGSAVIVSGPTSLSGRRLTVISSMAGRSVAKSDAGISLGDVPRGSLATFADADDPVANSRVFERVDLPDN